jgi:hypothetical protein
MQTAWQVAITVLSGVVIFVVGQVLQKIYIEPLQQLKRTIGQVASALTFYANTCDRIIDDEAKKEARMTLRRLSGELRGSLLTVPHYGLWRQFANLPPRAAVLDAASELIGLSNAVGSGDHEAWDRCMEAISQALRIAGVPSRTDSGLALRRHDREQSGLKRRAVRTLPVTVVATTEQPVSAPRPGTAGPTFGSGSQPEQDHLSVLRRRLVTCVGCTAGTHRSREGVPQPPV